MTGAWGLYMTGPIGVEIVPTKMLLGATMGALLGFAAGLAGAAIGATKETDVGCGSGAEEVRAGCTTRGGCLILVC